jgi:hypothetical protein
MNARTRSAALADYEKALSGFDAYTFNQPGAESSPSTRAGPGRAVASRRNAASVPGNLADAYVTHFLEKFHLAQLARRESWLPQLKQHVGSAAWAQAQLIAGVLNVAWDAQVLLPDRQGTSQQLFDAWRSTPAVANAIYRGQVRVDVPLARIQAWKEGCSQQATAAAEPNGTPATRPSNFRASG